MPSGRIDELEAALSTGEVVAERVEELPDGRRIRVEVIPVTHDGPHARRDLPAQRRVRAAYGQHARGLLLRGRR